MKKLKLIFAAVALFAAPVAALAGGDDEKMPDINGENPTYISFRSSDSKPQSGAAKVFENNFKFYGFIRNYITYDSRQSTSGTGELFYYLPKDRVLNAYDVDLNRVNSTKFLALTTRLGVDVSGYKFGNTHMGAKVETDFYTGLTGVTGTAVLRVRQAYLTLGWKELPYGYKGKADVNLKIGQAWHPMAADMPDVFSLATGAPFGPFSRTPQATMDAKLGKLVITGSAIWQMQYPSAGPSGASADYIKWSCVPEIYAGLSYVDKYFTGRIGLDMLSIKPRIQGKDNKGETVNVKDRITTVSPFMYLQYKKGLFSAKFKTIFAQAGEHVCLNGGYAVTADTKDDAVSYRYTPTRNSSTWVSLAYGKKWQGVLFGGYVKNFGTAEAIRSEKELYFSKNSFSNMNAMWRATPTVLYNAGKLTLGLECELTSVQYGSKINLSNALYDQDLHWVTNTRVQALVKFNF
ncbi:MAG: hypothetical protein HUJ94_08165 [Bacteroidales bacterium]|nr:hypothetical protein [Bacteroidales bacterium]